MLDVHPLFLVPMHYESDKTNHPGSAYAVSHWHPSQKQFLIMISPSTKSASASTPSPRCGSAIWILAALLLAGCATRNLDTSYIALPERGDRPDTEESHRTTRTERRQQRKQEQAERQTEKDVLKSDRETVLPMPAAVEETDDDEDGRPGVFSRLFRRTREEPTDTDAAKDVVDQIETPDHSRAFSSRAQAATRSSNVMLRPGLAIDVAVLVGGQREFELTGKRISDSGSIVLPLLGTLQVTEYTLDQLRQELAERYSRFFVDPEIITDFAQSRGEDGVSPWGHVTVLGRVRTPGRIMIPATRDLTVSGAIQRAGGFDTSARVSAIRVTRWVGDDETETRIVNLIAVGADGRLEDDILLMMDDVVFVPEARF